MPKVNGQFELLGCDIMIDDHMNPFLLEINTNPALFTTTLVQKEVIPQVLSSTLAIVLKLNSFTS